MSLSCGDVAISKSASRSRGGRIAANLNPIAQRQRIIDFLAWMEELTQSHVHRLQMALEVPSRHGVTPACLGVFTPERQQSDHGSRLLYFGYRRPLTNSGSGLQKAIGI
jgi:hypothetical protein